MMGRWQSQLHDGNAWDRLAPLWHAVFFGSLLVCTLVAMLVDREMELTTRGLTLLLSLGSAAWYYVFNLRTSRQRMALSLRLAYVVGAILFTFALINLHPVYYLMLFSLYGQTFATLPLRWAIGTTIVITALTAWQFILSRGLTTTSIIIAFLISIAAIVFGSVLGWFVDRIISESSARKALIVELETTRAELAHQEREAGILQERQRLAREIHDTLAQGFTSIVMQLEAADQALERDPPAAFKYLDTARQIARSSLDEARRVVADLRPDLLEQASLPDALRRTAEKWSQENDVSVRINVSGEINRLPPELEITLLRVTQEALTNVRKYAHASHVEVSLAYLEDVVTLDVQDDGVGMDGNPKAMNTSGGFGLVAMRERIEQLDGKLTIESAPGEGTTLAVELPLIVKRRASDD